MTKYSSEKKRQDYNFVPGDALSLDWDKLNELNDKCYLVLLNWRQISFIISHISRFPKFTWTWGEPGLYEMTEVSRARWREIQHFVNETEVCLQMGCELEEFIKVQRMLVAAIAGEQVVLSDPLPASVNYTTSGLSPKIAQLNTTMTEIRDKLNESNLNTDELEETLDAVNIILGGAAILGL